MKRPDRRIGLLAAAGVAVLAISIPVVAASPSASPVAAPAASARPDATAKPGASAKPDKANKGHKPDKGPETPISLTGIVVQATDDTGQPAFTMTVAGKTWTLSAGPSWYWRDKNPLAPFAGTSVTVAGTTHATAAEAEVDVETVDGTALREPGRPPWAGGPWKVGKTHPGWKSWMVDGKPGNGHGKASAPGQADKESAAP